MKINTRVLLKRLERAIALHCTVEQQRHAAAVLDKRGNILAIGVNRRDDNPAYGYSRHAEYDALTRGVYISKPYALFAARLTPLGWSLAAPCSGCSELLRLHKIKKVYYTTIGGGIECENL